MALSKNDLHSSIKNFFAFGSLYHSLPFTCNTSISRSLGSLSAIQSGDLNVKICKVYPGGDPGVAPRRASAGPKAGQDDNEGDEVQDGHHDCVVVLLRDEGGGPCKVVIVLTVEASPSAANCKAC